MAAQLPRTTSNAGSSSGIGAALARYLVDRGFGVALRDADFIAGLSDATSARERRCSHSP